MKIITLLSSGAAVCALAGALAFQSMPAVAQPAGGYDNGPQYSTPAEQQQTEQLNQQATDGTTQPPAALNGQPGGEGPYAQQAQYGGNPGDGAQQQPYQNGAPSAQQQQYDAQMQQYGQQQQRYQNQQQRYSSATAQYRGDLRAYDRATYDWSYPAPVGYEYGDNHGLRRLYLIADPSQQLSQVPVEGPNGAWVGRVRNVEIAPDGRPGRVEIALNRRVSVWVQPSDLRFDAEDRVVFTDLSRADLWQMPGATVESGPM
jgi:hypothetical protein